MGNGGWTGRPFQHSEARSSTVLLQTCQPRDHYASYFYGVFSGLEGVDVNQGLFVTGYVVR